MDVKKQLILFTLPNLNGGGAERVIINIIKSLDRDKFDIKLLLIDKIGVYFAKTGREDINLHTVFNALIL